MEISSVGRVTGASSSSEGGVELQIHDMSVKGVSLALCYGFLSVRSESVMNLFLGVVCGEREQIVGGGL